MAHILIKFPLDGLSKSADRSTDNIEEITKRITMVEKSNSDGKLILNRNLNTFFGYWYIESKVFSNLS